MLMLPVDVFLNVFLVFSLCSWEMVLLVWTFRLVVGVSRAGGLSFSALASVSAVSALFFCHCCFADFLFGILQFYFTRPGCALLLFYYRDVGLWGLLVCGWYLSLLLLLENLQAVPPCTVSGPSFSRGLEFRRRSPELLLCTLSHLVFCTFLLLVTLEDFIWVISSFTASVLLCVIALKSICWIVGFLFAVCISGHSVWIS